MPTLTIKGMPDELYQRLRDRATRNRRSLNAEVLVALETATGIRAGTGEEIMERIAARRRSLRPVDHERTKEYREAGRQ